VSEVATLYKIDRHCIIRIFSNEAGVFDFGNPITTRRKRKYRELRISQAALNRVMARLAVR